MISGKNIILLLLLLFNLACQPQGNPQKQNIEWAADIFLEEGAKWKLERYLGTLEAKSISIYSDPSYGEDDSKQLLFLQINESSFLASKTREQKEKVTERLAYLIFSKILYPYSYQNITLIHSEFSESTLESNNTDHFQRSYLPEQFDLGIEENIETEEYSF